jgi:hypothetical protein
MMAGILLGVGLLAGTADPGAAWPAFTSGAAINQGGASDTILVRDGGGKANVNRNKNVETPKSTATRM